MKYKVWFQLYQIQWNGFNNVEADSPEEAFDIADRNYYTDVEPDEEVVDKTIGPVYAEVLDETDKVLYTVLIGERP